MSLLCVQAVKAMTKLHRCSLEHLLFAYAILPKSHVLAYLVNIFLKFQNVTVECGLVSVISVNIHKMSRGMGFPTMWYVRPAKPQISLRSLIQAFASRLHIL